MEGLWGLILKAVTCLLLVFNSTVAAAMDYYVSPSGSDAASGTSPGNAWQTIARVNAQDLLPGDRVLFQGGATFAGNLLLDASDSGTPASPVVITSFDVGRATIDAGDGNGIYAYDCGGIEIRNLNLVGAGPGVDENNGIGVYFFTDRTDGTKFEHIRIDQVDASGFRRAGIGIKSDHSSLPGYRNVEITRCKAFNNGRTGIQVGGYYDNSTPALSHEDVLIAHCEVFDNRGDPTVTNNHTGSGIILSATNGAVIEFCHAYNNGEYNSSGNNGPVGIWAWQANDVIIQFNISNNNKSGSNKDGGGFDFDGGTTNSIMQYNYSYQNQGPGYLLAQFGGVYGAPPYHDNVFRYNISYNDGRGNNGGFLLWAGASISNIDIYGNTIYLTPPATGTPTPVRVFNGNYSNVRVRNNIFMTAPGLQLIRSNPNLSSQMLFQGNAYWTTDGGFEIEMQGTSYSSLAAWQAAGQEIVDGLPVGLHGDPKLVNPTSPELLTDPTQLTALSAFKLQSDSPVIDAGLDLLGNFGVDPGPRDFYGVPLPQGAALDIGAAEFTGSNPTPDIKANSSDGPVLIAPQDILSVTVELQAEGYSGVDADWWCVANTPFGWYYYDYNSDQWLPGFSASYQGALSDLSTYEVLNMTDLPTGDYTFYFGVDWTMNGLFDEPVAVYDSVDVEVTP